MMQSIDIFKEPCQKTEKYNHSSGDIWIIVFIPNTFLLRKIFCKITQTSALFQIFLCELNCKHSKIGTITSESWHVRHISVVKKLKWKWAGQ